MRMCSALSDGWRTRVGCDLSMAEFKIVIYMIIRRFVVEDVDVIYDVYPKRAILPKIRGRSQEPPQLNLRVKLVHDL